MGALFALVAIQGVWYVVVNNFAHENYVKTTATIEKIDENANRCYYRDYFCNRSPLLVPTYVYRDQNGGVHTYSDIYSSSFNKRSLTQLFFKNEVGSQVKVIFPKDNPDQPLFLNQFTAYAAWFVPLWIAGFLGFVCLVYLFIRFLQSL